MNDTASENKKRMGNSGETSRSGEAPGFFEALTEAVRVVSSQGPSLDEKLEICLRLALDQVGAERGSVMLKENDDRLVVRVSTVDDIVGLAQSTRDDGPASVAARNKNRPVTSDSRWSDGTACENEERGYKSEGFLSYPISFEGDVTGVINVTDKKEAGRFTQRDAAALSSFASVVSNAITALKLREERDKLKRLQKQKEDMINMIVHDLKGPAGAILSDLNMLESHISDGFGRELLESAENSAEDLMGMIMDILNVSRMEEGKFHLCVSEFDVVELAKEQTEKFKTLAEHEGKNVTFDSDVEKQTVSGDREILSRVLWNVLSNANNHTRRGGSISVGVRREGRGAVVSVADDGAGIPKEDLDLIFGMFAQSGRGSARRSSGIGLAFCKMAVEAHGGKITVDSEPGRGAVFSVHIP